jgi:transglutaminase/protease-like cytokinesis protein 3
LGSLLDFGGSSGGAPGGTSGMGSSSVSKTTSNTAGSPASSLSKSYTVPESYETAYSYRTDTPYQNMKNIPKNIDSLRTSDPDEYVKQVVDIINKNAKNDFEKVKMAHDLVAVLVKYDAASFWAGTVPDQSYRNVLKNRLAVCEGYSNTFKKFCDELTIPCDKVIGFGRGVGTSPLAGDTPNDSNHAWNIVQSMPKAIWLTVPGIPVSWTEKSQNSSIQRTGFS